MPSIVFEAIIMKRTLVSLVVGMSLALLAACSGSDGSDVGADVSTMADPDDVAFVQGMIPHHQQAIEMSALALDGRAGAVVADLARRIDAAQGPEIIQLREILSRWSVEEDEHHMHKHGGDANKMGMLTDDQLQDLASLSGEAFDRRFAESMMMHHEGAVAMAETVLANGADDEVRVLAKAIIAAQQAEIAEMKALLAG
jgi:uncharacterized protein (DUF305 family)